MQQEDAFLFSLLVASCMLLCVCVLVGICKIFTLFRELESHLKFSLKTLDHYTDFQIFFSIQLNIIVFMCQVCVGVCGCLWWHMYLYIYVYVQACVWIIYIYINKTQQLCTYTVYICTIYMPHVSYSFVGMTKNKTRNANIRITNKNPNSSIPLLRKSNHLTGNITFFSILLSILDFAIFQLSIFRLFRV